MLIPEHGSIHLFKIQFVDGVPCIPGTVNHTVDGNKALFVYAPEYKSATAAYKVSKHLALYPVAKGGIIIDYKNNTTDGIKLLCYQVISIQPNVAITALIGVAHFCNNIIKGENSDGKH